MKQKLLLFLLTFEILITASACGSSPAEPTGNLHFADMYPNLCPVYLRGSLTRARWDELRETAWNALDTTELYDRDDVTISISENSVTVYICIIEQCVNSEPDDWEEIKENAIDACEQLQNSLEGKNSQSVLVLRDSLNNVLLTLKSGEIIYEKFHMEVSQESAAEAGQIDASYVHTNSTNGNNASDIFVYVSNSGHKIHSIPDCSGMKHYTAMTLSEANENNYSYCSNCW